MQLGVGPRARLDSQANTLPSSEKDSREQTSGTLGCSSEVQTAATWSVRLAAQPVAAYGYNRDRGLVLLYGGMLYWLYFQTAQAVRDVMLRLTYGNSWYCCGACSFERIDWRNPGPCQLSPSIGLRRAILKVPTAQLFVMNVHERDLKLDFPTR